MKDSSSSSKGPSHSDRLIIFMRHHLKLRRFILVVAMVFALSFSLTLVNAQSPVEQSENELRVVTKEVEPFVMLDKDGNLTGFSIEFWDEIAARLGLETNWVVVETIPEQIQIIQQEDADAAISAISITPGREKVVDFSYPYFDAGLRILVRADSGEVTLLSILRTIFSASMVKVILGSLLIIIIMAHVIWLIERGHNPEMPKPYLSGIWEAIWWSTKTISTHEYGEGEEPKTFSRRLMAIIIIFVGIIVLAQFTASITSSLTVRQLNSEIHELNDLEGKNIVTVTGSTAAAYLEKKQLTYSTVDRIDHAYPLLKSREMDAIIFDSPVLIYWVKNYGFDKMEIVGPVLTEEMYGIALPMNSPWRKRINTEILNMQVDGTYDVLYEKWFGNQK